MGLHPGNPLRAACAPRLLGWRGYGIWTALVSYAVSDAIAIGARALRVGKVRLLT